MEKRAFRAVLDLARRYGRVLAVILVVGISQSYIGMLSLVFFQRLLDGLPGARHFADLAAPLAGYIGLTVANHLLIYAEGYPTSILKNGAFQAVKLIALRKIAVIDYLAYQNLGTGNLVQIVENGAAALRDILTGFYLNVLRSILPSIVISLAFIDYYDRTLFIAILAGYGVLYVLSYYLMRFLRAEMEKMLASQEDFSKFSVRAFMELVVFRVNGRFKAEFERVRAISDEIVRARAKIYLLQELFATGFAFLVFIVEALVVVQQVSKILAGESTVGTLVALVSFIRIVFWPITTFNYAYMEYKLNLVAYDRLNRLLHLPDDPGLIRTLPLEVRGGAISFRRVSFSYAEHDILQDFSLEIPAGQAVAFVGASGSGKSTLVRLLLQLVKPASGRILIDGQDLAEVNLESYYRQVAYIPQEPPIFDGTLRENITFERSVDPARLDDALRKAGLSEYIAQLPAGLETLVGERGVKLSGGERQRVAFARLLVQDPKIVIMDEPTSALDSRTEQIITSGLREDLAGKTILMIAHRLQTVRDAGRIYVMEAGQLVEDGCFEDLLARQGKFTELWVAQTHLPAG
jgi:ATP-binding cassette subfamily B protein